MCIVHLCLAAELLIFYTFYGINFASAFANAIAIAIQLLSHITRCKDERHVCMSVGLCVAAALLISIVLQSS